MLTRGQKRKREEAVVLLEEPNLTNELPDEMNPLLNDVVLGCLFKMCPLSDLLRFRLVSKQWYSLTLARCRKEMTVVIRPLTFPIRTIRWMVDEEFEWESLYRTLDIGDQPFRSYCLSFVTSSCYRSYPNDVVNANATKDNSLRRLNTPFFNKFGSSIHKLELCEVWAGGLFAILAKTPNLEELILNDICQLSRIAQREEQELDIQPNLKFKHLVLKRSSLTLPFSWNFFLRHFPNIQRVDASLVLGAAAETSLKYLTEISQELNNNKNLKFFFSLIEFSPSPFADTLLAIRAFEVKLPQTTIHKIKISCWSHDWNDDEKLRQLISAALRNHGHTLKELELFAVCRRTVDWFDDFTFHPGPFTSLTTLELSGQFCKNLCFLAEFPNVSTLKISDNDEETIWTGMGGMDITLTNLRVFHFSTKSTIPDYLLTMLVDLMPNVEDFVGILSDSSLTIICDKWRKLKRLFIGSREFSLKKRRITDEAITGIVAGSDERLPNITYLQDLESLSIPKPERMSDACIWNGFLKMPRLQRLSVQLSKETTDEAFQALIKKFPGNAIFRDVRRRRPK